MTLNAVLGRFQHRVGRALSGRKYEDKDAAADFRHLFQEDLGDRVLHVLLRWCGEYEGPPAKDEDLPRYAAKREIAHKIKAALFADLSEFK